RRRHAKQMEKGRLRMSGFPRDLAVDEVWNASLERSRARRARANRGRLRPTASIATGQETINSSAPNPEPATTTEHSIVLSSGAEGRQVQLLQQALGNVKVDGVFGPETEEAVRSLQASHGLTVDGIVGPQTSAALRGGSGKAFAASFKS